MPAPDRPNSRRRFALAAALALAAAWPPALVQGSGAPLRPGVPFTPGTGIDPIARQVGPHLAQRLGRPVVVENKPGASGNLGTAEVARRARRQHAAGDGEHGGDEPRAFPAGGLRPAARLGELPLPLAEQLKVYERHRAPRTARGVEESTEMGELDHIGDAAGMRQAFLDRNIAKSRNEWLYPYDPLSAPLG